MPLFKKTDKVVIVELGLAPVWSREYSDDYFTKREEEGFSVYEVVHKDGVMSIREAKERYPEMMV
jgi:hypothetical protein